MRGLGARRKGFPVTDARVALNRAQVQTTLHDLTTPVDALTPPWPGDQPFRRASRWSIEAGDAVNVDTVTTTTHIGTHIDAPSHVRSGGHSIDRTPLDACIGDCLIVDVRPLVGVSTSPHGFAPLTLVRSRIAALARGVGREASSIKRVLLRHRDAPVSTWDGQTPGLDPAFVQWFGDHGGRLIGIDLLSFDPETSKMLPAHSAAIDAGVVMLEGLDLTRVPEGFGDLIALPALWIGADAAPVRAVFRREAVCSIPTPNPIIPTRRNP
ncbi:cyclase family protein [Pseudoclavibacter sp. AY1F1]|uniref:cyclase family protein n=1 Tax=Pseudoclavibacter sp. AY1F1 TaxID=2080583 RepID=UPI0015E453EE